MDRSDLTVVTAACVALLAGCVVIDGFGDLEVRDGVGGGSSSGEGPATGAGGLAGSSSGGGGGGAGAGGDDAGHGGGGEDSGAGGGGGEPSGDLLPDPQWVVPVPVLQDNCRHVVTDVLRDGPFTWASGVTVTTNGESCTIPLGKTFTFSNVPAGSGRPWVVKIDSGGEVLTLRVPGGSADLDGAVGGMDLEVRPALLASGGEPWMAFTGNDGRGVEVLTAEPHLATNIVAADGGSAIVSDIFAADTGIYVTGLIQSPGPIAVSCFDLPEDGPVAQAPTGFLARFEYRDPGPSSCALTLFGNDSVVWSGRAATSGALLAVDAARAAEGTCGAVEGLSLLAVTPSPYACLSILEQLGDIPAAPGFPIRMDTSPDLDVLALRTGAGTELRARAGGDPFTASATLDGEALDVRDVVASSIGRSVVVGSREGALVVGARQISGSGDPDGFLALVDPEGTPLAVVDLGVGGDDVVTAVDEDVDRLVLAGHADGAIDLPFLGVAQAGAWIAAFPPP
jgi:hypothetical protein